MLLSEIRRLLDYLKSRRDSPFFVSFRHTIDYRSRNRKALKLKPRAVMVRSPGDKVDKKLMPNEGIVPGR